LEAWSLPWLAPDARLQDAATEKAQAGKGLAAVKFPALITGVFTLWPGCSLA